MIAMHRTSVTCRRQLIEQVHPGRGLDPDAAGERPSRTWTSFVRRKSLPVHPAGNQLMILSPLVFADNDSRVYHDFQSLFSVWATAAPASIGDEIAQPAAMDERYVRRLRQGEAAQMEK